MSRLPGLTHALIDDAAVFPPGNAPLATALADYHARRDGPRESLVGPLLVPASAVEELRTLVDPSQVTPIGLIADTGLAGAVTARDAIQDDAWIDLVQVELRLSAADNPAQEIGRLLTELPFTVPVYVELAPESDLLAAIAAIGADGAERAKLRCGPEDVPSVSALATFIHGCVQLGVPFKLTGGLHRAFPHDLSADSTQHGFVNTLAATWAALDGGDLDAVASILLSRDNDLVLGVLDAADVKRLRDRFRSFGSCSVDEPYDDLIDLQLLSEDD